MAEAIIGQPDPIGDAQRTPFSRARALDGVVANLAPSSWFLVPFALVVGALLRNEVDEARVGWWILTSVVATALVLVAVRAHRRTTVAEAEEADRSVPPMWVVLLVGAAHAAIGVLFGLCPWLGADRGVDVLMLLVLFPACMACMAAIVTAGRLDMYLAVAVPLSALSAAGLYATGEARFRALAVVAVFFAASLIALHRVLSRAVYRTIHLQQRSDALVQQLATDRQQLTAVNQQLAASIHQLTHQATHDPLTGLRNRRGAFDEIERLVAAASERRPVALLFCDLDHFKSINDALGHRGGDQFISVIADRIARGTEAGSVSGRIGGDEFVIALPGLDLAAASAVASRLVGVLGQPVHAEAREMPSSVSIGVAAAPLHGTTAAELMRHANAALYRAKKNGRNRMEMFDGSMQRELVDRLEAEQALRRAIDDGEIMPYFQPEIDASSGHIVGAELLARWVRRNGKVVPAQDFIALAARAGLLERITDRVLNGARPQIRRLAMLGLPDGFRFRINVAPEATERSWRDNPIDQLVQGLDPSLLTVDVREAAVIADLPAAAANLAAFRARGGRVCLDDFARGVSSLSLLRRLPLDEVRIDRVSIDTIITHPHDRAIVRSIIAVVREIGFAVTADGVETGAQADALIALGCVRQQGHLYAPALPADEFESFLLQRLAERYAQSNLTATAWETNELT